MKSTQIFPLAELSWAVYTVWWLPGWSCCRQCGHLTNGLMINSSVRIDMLLINSYNPTQTKVWHVWLAENWLKCNCFFQLFLFIPVWHECSIHLYSGPRWHWSNSSCCQAADLPINCEVFVFMRKATDSLHHWFLLWAAARFTECSFLSSSGRCRLHLFFFQVRDWS